MRSLASLLEGAVRRAAFEVRLESGQPVVYTTARGAEAEASVLPRSELFDMIVAAVDDQQQIELAVGNPVEFKVEAGARWSVSAEPGQDGITVRAQRPGKPPAPPPQPAPPPPAYHDVGPAVGFELAEPDYGAQGGAPTLLSSAWRPRPPVEAPPSQLYVAALDVPVVDDTGANQFIASESSGAPPFESGTWALDDDDELDVGLEEPDEDSLPNGFVAVGSADPHIGVPDDDDDDAAPQFDPFAEPPPPDPMIERRRTLSPTLKAMEVSTPTSKLPVRKPPPAHMPPASSPRDDISQRITLREFGAMRPSDGATQRELASIGNDRLLSDVAEGTLVYVLEPGFADILARSSQAPAISIGDPHPSPAEVWARVRELPVGALVIVRCEDPSSLLDGILRRLEEGYRVFVETRARTVAGARRMLLGVSATDRAERWLDEQRTLIVEPGEGGPRLVPFSR